MILHHLDVLTLGVVISKLKCYKRMSSLNRGWTSWHSTSSHMTLASWVNKGCSWWIQNQTSIQVHHWSPLLDQKGFKNPSSSPIVLPPKDLCFLPVDGMHRLLDMHGNSILRILVLLFGGDFYEHVEGAAMGPPCHQLWPTSTCSTLSRGYWQQPH